MVDRPAKARDAGQDHHRGALLAELIDGIATGETELFSALIDVLDRRVEAVRDRLTVRDLLGNAPLPLRPGGPLDEALPRALEIAGDEAKSHFGVLGSGPDAGPDEADPHEFRV